jgi:uncharacterized protein YjbI with pentapeptide repeats
LLSNANLIGVDLSKAILLSADLSWAILSEANLSEAQLIYTVLRAVDFRKTNLTASELNGSHLVEAILEGSDFTGMSVIGAVFGGLDFRSVTGLETIRHLLPSTIGTDTLVSSAGSIPEVFLRGCGLSDWEIEIAKLYNPDISNEQRDRILYRVHDLQVSQAIQISPLFISYSHADSEFADKIGDRLNKKGIRYWRDIHDMKAGHIETQINRAIRQNPTVLLILSKNSLNSDWVEHEARTARILEKDLGRDVLRPIALDPTWNSKDNRWPRHVMEQIMEYNILDFSTWQDDSKFDGTFRKLIDGLELFYKK